MYENIYSTFSLAPADGVTTFDYVIHMALSFANELDSVDPHNIQQMSMGKLNCVCKQSVFEKDYFQMRGSTAHFGFAILIQ